MGKLNDLTGKKFGKLTVISRCGTTNGRNAIWLCKCDCGNYTKVFGNNLGKTKSCGCLLKNQLKTHGYSKTRLYKVYMGMKARCYRKNHKEYNHYGGKGITICKEWLDFENFYNWAINNGYNDNAKYGECTIDRINVNGNYEPDNCRWITIQEQSNNTTKNHLVTYNNETHNLKEWSKILNINYGTLLSRINRSKWTIEKALTMNKNERRKVCL